MNYRVGLFNDSFPPTIDGVANTVVNYAKCIKNQGGEPIVVTPKYPHVTDDYPFAVYRYQSLGVEQFIGYRAGNPFNPVMLRELRSMKMDLYHVHCPFASAVLVRALRGFSRRVPVVLTYHTKFDIDIRQRVHSPHLQKIVRKFVLNNIKAADEVWAVSQGAAESLRHLGYRGGFRVMQNGTDFRRGLSPAGDIREVGRLHQLGEDEMVFVFVGRMMWYKNTKLIIDALRKSRAAGLRFKMLFVGDGSDRAAMEQYTRACGMSDVIAFAGAIHDRERLRAYYSRADLFLFPSTYDTSGLVVKEAAACDCPSVLVRGSCAAEGVRDGFSGYLAEENADAVANVILSAAADPDRLHQVGRNAGEHVYLSWNDAVKIAAERYGEILGRRY